MFFTKIILNSKFDENEIYEKLISENIYPEGKIGNTILFIANFWNSDNLQRLAKYLNSLILPLKKEESYEFLKAKNKRTFSAQKDCPFELIDAKNCLGRKLAISIGRYPPGVLEIFQGEIIDKERQKFIIKNKQNLLGIINGKVGVVKDE